LPLLAALLVLSAQPVGMRVVATGEASVVAHGRDAAPGQSGDFVTRKNRHAASIDEFFAIDDDSDQHARSLHAAVRTPDFAPVAVERRNPPVYRGPRPDRRARAHLSTGPPQA
jgi:hypothetical protein